MHIVVYTLVIIKVQREMYNPSNFLETTAVLTDPCLQNF